MLNANDLWWWYSTRGPWVKSGLWRGACFLKTEVRAKPQCPQILERPLCTPDLWPFVTDPWPPVIFQKWPPGKANWVSLIGGFVNKSKWCVQEEKRNQIRDMMNFAVFTLRINLWHDNKQKPDLHCSSHLHMWYKRSWSHFHHITGCIHVSFSFVFHNFHLLTSQSAFYIKSSFCWIKIQLHDDYVNATWSMAALWCR